MTIHKGPQTFVNTDNPQETIDETRSELDDTFKKQRTGFMGFINRLFGGSKMIDEAEREAKEAMDEMEKELRDNKM